MGNSPFRSNLYRRGWWAVTCIGLVLIATGALRAQFAPKATVSKGPRAVGLLRMPAKGKPRLIPVAIMVNGRFYDASAYKADPVPMALEPGTVYEAERTGESLGLFTINQVLQQKNNWIAEGTYHANGEQVASKAHKAETKPREETDEGPPKLHRPGSESPKSSNPAPEPKPAGPPPTTPSSAKTAPPPPPPPAEEDPNIPRLRRGVPEKSPSTEDSTSEEKPSGKNLPTKGPSSSPAQASQMQLVPAISDASGPEPRPYSYEMKPDEEQSFRTKMLAMAADELRKQAKELEPEKQASPSRRRAGTRIPSKPPQPSFEDVQLRVFDVSSSNEPVLVLTATAHPAAGSASATKPADYYIALVARSDIYGELRTLLSVVTDSQHLDVQPRLQLIDAVDADGDGRGELLFREISDAGSAYSIYRVTPDRLWSLYESSPQ